MPCTFTRLDIEGLILVEPRVFPDGRGSFMETYKKSEFVANGIDVDFVQDNQSVSAKNVVRGLHFQKAPHAQAKLVRVLAGSVWDVAVDLRHASDTFGRWCGVELSAENRKMLFIPAGFAHGFVSLEDNTVLAYKCSAEYAPAVDGGIRWNDPDIGVQWPVDTPLVSEKDARLPFLNDVDVSTLFK